ncbi:hypothetical protein KUCAC02_000191 [Chaenocephalus aceratus]|uniref:Uncharacterized protein n=1 Tax=Chaenocephalus aceratus TaxID=36190 RepID=A0ACB9W4U9_CHAAC|nr:hypothetical protein KUCAC02_000191 [Chaenocephalus aceratus]
MLGPLQRHVVSQLSQKCPAEASRPVPRRPASYPHRPSAALGVRATRPFVLSPPPSLLALRVRATLLRHPVTHRPTSYPHRPSAALGVRATRPFVLSPPSLLALLRRRPPGPSYPRGPSNPRGPSDPPPSSFATRSRIGQLALRSPMGPSDPSPSFTTTTPSSLALRSFPPPPYGPERPSSLLSHYHPVLSSLARLSDPPPPSGSE